jgi:toxin ParE1/3/4
MSEYRLAPRAESDLDEIAAHISIENPPAALRVIDALQMTFELLGRHPDAGRSEEKLLPGLRVFPGFRPAHHYVILYRKSMAGIEIAAVVHGSRNWRQTTAEPEGSDE